jgi:hypothetical protein
MNRARLKLRNTWDLVIQGNTVDLGSAISEAMESIETTEKKFNHLFHQFPNCRFVYRLYSRFKLEICADQEKYQELNHQAEQMKNGSIIVPDDAHVLGMIQFPNLPFITKEANTQILSNNINDENHSELQENIDQDQGQEKYKLEGHKFSMEQQNAMKKRLEISHSLESNSDKLFLLVCLLENI